MSRGMQWRSKRSYLRKNRTSSCVKEITRVKKVEDDGFGGEFAVPDGEGSVAGFVQRNGPYFPVLGDKDLLVVESNDFG